MKVTSIGATECIRSPGSLFDSESRRSLVAREMAADSGRSHRVTAIAPGEIDTAILRRGRQSCRTIPLRAWQPDEAQENLMLCTETVVPNAPRFTSTAASTYELRSHLIEKREKFRVQVRVLALQEVNERERVRVEAVPPSGSPPNRFAAVTRVQSRRQARTVQPTRLAVEWPSRRRPNCSSFAGAFGS